MSIWTGEFWKATGERVIITAVQGAVIAFGYDVSQAIGPVDAFTFGWQRAAGFALGGAVLSLFKCILANAATKTGPSLTDAEVVPRRALEDS